MNKIISTFRNLLTDESIDPTNELVINIDSTHLFVIRNAFAKKRFTKGATTQKKVWLRKMSIGKRKFRRKFKFLEKLNITFPTVHYYDKFQEVKIIDFLEKYYPQSNNGKNKVNCCINKIYYKVTFVVAGRLPA